MGGDEDIHIKVFRLDKDGQLAIKAEWQVREGRSAAVGEVEVDSDELPCGAFEKETVLAEEPDCYSIRRDFELPDGLHVFLAALYLGDYELNGGGSIVGIVVRENIFRFIHGWVGH
jgi:hypothetical protein